MKILLAASEMTPYAKTGGLGDVVGALAGVLSQRGHEVTCCLPYYRQVREELGGPRTALHRSAATTAPLQEGAKPIGLTLSIPLGSRTVTGDVLELRQPDGVRVLFVRRDEFFDRSELYHTGVRDYEDNAERFLFFSKAVVELFGYTRFRPDVVHCHDWQTAFVPVQAWYRAQARGAEFAMKTVLTIHNIAYQGMFWSLDFPLTNLPGEFFTPETLEYYGQMNLLKGGIVFADAITTVSQTYAEEIQTTDGGFGLDTVLGTRADDVHGIVNGVDYARWNPETDPHLRHHYTMDDLSGKAACRAELLERLGLTKDEPTPNPSKEGSSRPTPNPSKEGSSRPTPNPSKEGSEAGMVAGGTQVVGGHRPPLQEDANPVGGPFGLTQGGRRPPLMASIHDEPLQGNETALHRSAATTAPRPVAAFVSRLTEQKGVELLAEALEDLVKSGLTVAILGKGEQKYEELLTEAAARFPGRVSVTIAHDEALAHLLQAGADILLMPSHFEPCGLTQLYALKYGTIPVVRATGGLEDTVAQFDARTVKGTGFKFAEYTAAAFVGAVQPAILLHKQPKKWQKLMRNAMACDFSWQASAKEYEKLYAAL